MKLLLTIHDQDVTTPTRAPEHFSRRTAARAIVTDQDGAVALLHVSRQNYHKLPGGGVEEGEDLQTALARELLQEIGCSAEITGEVGSVDEYRHVPGEFQTSYCYTAKVVGAKGHPDFTVEERADGFEVVWVASVEEAIKLLEKDNPRNYEGKFINKRDLCLLRTA